MRSRYDDEIVWIIGASSGIGRALAVELNHRGARVIVSSRRRELLESLASEYSLEMALPVDVCEPAALRTALDNIIRHTGGIDRILFMSASYQPMTLDDLSLNELRTMVDVNLVGAFNLIQACFPLLVSRGKCQLAFCASVAGYRGLPRSQPYASTKAALINLAESLRAEATGTGVDVRLICPGFVRTPLTDLNDFDMPAIMEPSEAARRIADGLKSAHFEIHFPKRLSLALKFAKLLPYGLWFALIKGASVRR